jgi:hypothetical protein
MPLLQKRLLGKHIPTFILRLFFIVSIFPIIIHFIFSSHRPKSLSSHSLSPPIALPFRRQPAELVNHFSSTPSITFSIVTFGHRFSRYAETTLPNWFQTFPNSSLIIFNGRKTDLEEITRAIRRYSDRIRFGPPLETDELGIPYVDDFIQKSIDLSTTDFLCLIMQDAVLSHNFSWTINFLNEYFARKKQQFGVIGRRCVAFDSPKKLAKLNPSLDWISAVQNEEFSNDFIVMDKRNNVLDFSEVKPFHIGMHVWDVWFVSWLRKQIPMVSMGSECGSIHLKHKPEPMLLAKVQENYEMAGFIEGEAGLARGMKWKIEGRKLKEGDRIIAICEVK